MTSPHLHPKLTEIDYSDAIDTLMPIAVKDCGGSRACALVLLNAYNADAFRFDITDLCVLDDKLYNAALVVIRCRAELCREPHEFIPNGDQVFEDLAAQWKRHAIKKRGR